jgi:predicted AAA+ superfamily ATPase
MIKRIIKLPKNSFFLFGPRQTGKTTLINLLFQKNTWKINLLWTDSFLKYSKSPQLFRLEAEQKIKSEGISHIFIDEIQRVPILLNEVHYLIETYPYCQFIMTGSSARKLRRGGTNLLAGRAFERFLFPFTYKELGENIFLDEILKFGTIPPLLNKNPNEKSEILSSYVNTYLREEIQAEGIARNIGGFSRFLDVAAGQFSELINFSAIGRDCSLPVRTVQSYYEILEDTLIGFRLEPWRKSIRKRLRAHSKFYFFDNGVTNAINTMLSATINGTLKGKLFEQFIVQEVYRAISYSLSEARIYYWRTNHGAEVDLIIEKHGRIKAALEIKSSAVISGAHLSGLRAFRHENEDVPLYVITTNDEAYELDGVNILPWRNFIYDLDRYL